MHIEVDLNLLVHFHPTLSHMGENIQTTYS